MERKLGEIFTYNGTMILIQVFIVSITLTVKIRIKSYITKNSYAQLKDIPLKIRILLRPTLTPQRSVWMASSILKLWRLKSLSVSLRHSIKYWDEMRKMMYGKLTSFLIIEKNHNILFGVSDLVVNIVFLTKVMNIFQVRQIILNNTTSTTQNERK